MVRSTAGHNLIAGGFYAAVTAHLSGSSCRAFLSDMKVRVDRAFYYPDVVVTGSDVRPEDVYVTEPVVIVEVLSESTEARDRFEKRLAYLVSDRKPAFLGQPRAPGSVKSPGSHSLPGSVRRFGFVDKNESHQRRFAGTPFPIRSRVFHFLDAQAAFL